MATIVDRTKVKVRSFSNYKDLETFIQTAGNAVTIIHDVFQDNSGQYVLVYERS